MKYFDNIQAKLRNVSTVKAHINLCVVADNIHTSITTGIFTRGGEEAEKIHFMKACFMGSDISMRVGHFIFYPKNWVAYILFCTNMRVVTQN